MVKIKIILGLLAGVLSLTACSKDDTLIVYSGRSDKFVKPILEAFEKESGIKTQVHIGSATTLINRMELEGEETKADIYISNDAGNLHLGAQKGLFLKLPGDMVQSIPENFRAADNAWIGLSGRARVLVARKNDPQTQWVKSVFDLADPRLKGKIAITQSANESFIAGVTVYMETKGKQATQAWLEGIKTNSTSAFPKHSAIVTAVAEGRKVIGLVNHYYIYRHLAKQPDAPIKIILPDQGDNGMGLAWNIAGAAIAKHSDKKDKAKKLIAFLVSKQGQKMFAEVNREYPTREDVDAADAVPSRGSLKIADVPMAVIGEKRDATLDLIDKVGLP